MTKYAEVLENKAADKMTDDAYKLSLSLIEHQRTDNVIDAHTETDQINMKSSLKKEIQCNSFLIFDIKDDSSASASTQRSCKVSQRIIDAVTHKKN